MKVRFTKIVHGGTGVIYPGERRDMRNDEAELLISMGYAVREGEPESVPEPERELKGRVPRFGKNRK